MPSFQVKHYFKTFRFTLVGSVVKFNLNIQRKLIFFITMGLEKPVRQETKREQTNARDDIMKAEICWNEFPGCVYLCFP